MRSLKKKGIWLILSVSVILVVMAGCSAKGDKPLVFADAGWDSIQFHNYVRICSGETRREE